MKRIFFTFLAAGSLALFSCNNNNSENGEESSDATTKEDEKEETSSDLEKAAVAYCDCMNESFESLSAKTKKMVIKASKSDNPEQVFRSEMIKITDENEQVQITEEFSQIENNEGLKACADRVKKKYAIDEDSKTVQKQLLREMEAADDCELVAAFMRIGMSTQNATRPEDGGITEQ